MSRLRQLLHATNGCATSAQHAIGSGGDAPLHVAHPRECNTQHDAANDWNYTLGDLAELDGLIDRASGLLGLPDTVRTRMHAARRSMAPAAIKRELEAMRGLVSRITNGDKK